jgi:hypothetical protein
MKKSVLQSLRYLGLASVFVFSAGSLYADAIPSGWTCVGTCGSLGSDGVVTLSPTGNSSYQYVSTTNGTNGVGSLPSGSLGSETNGSTLATTVFSATAGTALNFYFNFVTSDGAGYADYAWAELYDSANNPVSLLFTARTLSSGTIVPGFGMPAPNATLTPGSVPIIAIGRIFGQLLQRRVRQHRLDQLELHHRDFRQLLPEGRSNELVGHGL